MRAAFVKALTEIASKDKRVFLLTGDLGFSVLEGFRDKFPSRFINAGVAEANMVGVAAGLAMTGKIPYIYSIVPFVTLRCLEQVRNDICYQGLNVRIVGIGGGLSYGTAAATHYSLEDIAVMRAMPGLTVVCPGDPLEAEAAVRASANCRGPVYIRLGKGGDPSVHKCLKSFKIGKALFLNNGRDAAIISTGNMLANTVKAAELLKAKGIDAGVISMHTIKPFDSLTVAKLARTVKAIFTVEEHAAAGGLGGVVAEALAAQPRKVLFKSIAVRENVKFIGSQNYLRVKLGLDPEGIATAITKAIRKQ